MDLFHILLTSCPNLHHCKCFFSLVDNGRDKSMVINNLWKKNLLLQPCAAMFPWTSWQEKYHLLVHLSISMRHRELFFPVLFRIVSILFTILSILQCVAITFWFSWIPTEFGFDNVASLGTLVYVGSRLTQRAKMHFNHHQMLLSHLQVLDVFFNIILTAVFRIILCLFIYWYQCGTVVCLCSSRLHAPGSFEFCKLICLTLLFF